jgi:hypothetical protein
LAFEARVQATSDLPRPPAAGFVQRAERLAARLEAAGWSADGLHARAIAARVALARGEPERARKVLSATKVGIGAAPVSIVVELQLVAGLTALARGDRPAASRALRRGLQVVAANQSGFGGIELRARAGALGQDLARTGLRMALESGRPGRVLEWAEHWRAGSLRLPRLRPPADPESARILTELRRLSASSREAALQGRADQALAAEISENEHRLRKRWRHLPGSNRSAPSFDRQLLEEALGPRVLIEYVVLEGQVAAVVVRNGRARLHHLGPLSAIDSEINQLRFHLQRSIRPGATEASAAAASDGLRLAGSRLGGALIEPLRVEAEEAVVIPTGRLHAVVWRAVQGLAGMTMTVAPSASWWAQTRLQGSNAKPGPALLVAGPGLEAADDEVAALGRVYPNARMIGSRAATIAAVADALHRASLAHFAAHGRFRADNPLFSSLLMVDGPLMVYDFETIEALPETIVLSACDAALNEVGRGDELIGLAAGLNTMGVHTLVAPVIPVPDQEVGRFMIDLHGHLRLGKAVPQALRDATEEAHREGPREAAIAHSFVCLGASRSA